MIIHSFIKSFIHSSIHVTQHSTDRRYFDSYFIRPLRGILKPFQLNQLIFFLYTIIETLYISGLGSFMTDSFMVQVTRSS